jgi:hypothetical protein
MASEPEMPEQTPSIDLIDRREAIRRVTALLGGIALVGGNALLTGCREDRRPGGGGGGDDANFSAEDIAFLDEVADTILPETKTPGAKAAKVGAFMALMVKDTYDEPDQKVFREGMRKLDDASKRTTSKSFMEATPQQRLTVLEALDREQKAYTDALEAKRAARAQSGAAAQGTVMQGEGEKGAAADTAAPKSVNPEKQADAHLPDQRQENAPTGDVGGAAAITQDEPAHYFRMMKELALLGYFTSEIGYTKAMRYVESPGRYDPCVPYTAGETAWAPHA